MANIYLGNTPLGKGGITPVNTLPTANAENYDKHELYLNDGELKYIVETDNSYDYETLYSSDVVTTISFTIAGDTYQAEDGMTWTQWCNSAYNTGGFNIYNTVVMNDSFTKAVAYNSAYVSVSDTIVENRAYGLKSYGGGGN